MKFLIAPFICALIDWFTNFLANKILNDYIREFLTKKVVSLHPMVAMFLKGGNS